MAIPEIYQFYLHFPLLLLIHIFLICLLSLSLFSLPTFLICFIYRFITVIFCVSAFSLLHVLLLLELI